MLGSASDATDVADLAFVAATQFFAELEEGLNYEDYAHMREESEVARMRRGMGLRVPEILQALPEVKTNVLLGIQLGPAIVNR